MSALDYPEKPSKGMLDAGIEALNDCIDQDWDSGPAGDDHNSYVTIRSDAPAIIYAAMRDAWIKENRNSD